jgi:hypothetical protein
VIDYTQLGLDYKIYLAQLYFNYAISLKQDPRASQDALEAAQSLCDEASTSRLTLTIEDEEDTSTWKQIIKDAHSIKRATPFLIPSNAIYKPDERKVQNSENVDYLGSSLVIASVSKNLAKNREHVCNVIN